LKALRAPFGLQVTAVLLLTLIVAQAATVAVVLLTPPPQPRIYQLGDVAAALQGQPRPAAAGFGPAAELRGPPLTRLPNADFTPAPAEDQSPSARLLAQLMRLPPDRVSLVEAGPPFPFSMMRPGGGEVGPRRAFAARGPEPPPDGAGPMRVRPMTAFERPLFGDFTAALRQVDGSWVVVRPPPERFPTPWQRRLAAWLVACLLLVGPVGFLLARRITAPLRDFARAAERLGRDPRAPLMNASGPAEVTAAAQAFNEMQTRLTRYVDDRTAMVGAISHDLRTPLARIRFKLETAPDALRGQVIPDLEQMEQMISAVMSFLRDASEVRDRQRLDLLSVLEVVADDAALLGGRVGIETELPLTVEADAVALKRLFANLVDNAIKYGGEARIRLTREGDEAVTQITDSGPGLTPAELERVFEPFYRAEAARTLEGGVGLGLAAARSIARAHGGDVTLANHGAGLTATVRLPLPKGV
jgi:two-component system OmpR family sensor kinase